MIWQSFISLLSTTIVGQDPNKVAQGANNAASAVDVGGGMFGGASGMLMILVYVAIFGAMWFFMIRPQRKREKQMREMQASIKAGDSVVTSSGFFGKVVSTGEDCFIVEFGTIKGIRIPVRKSDIVGIKTPNINPSTSPAELNK